ncbi:hypothetical protein KCP73_19455 [Salmonella enterica subsp. enterica]|nr:hypothetical protein KCP73_19455 [Salmonella enterica subsp. enterica]
MSPARGIDIPDVSHVVLRHAAQWRYLSASHWSYRPCGSQKNTAISLVKPTTICCC